MYGIVFKRAILQGEINVHGLFYFSSSLIIGEIHLKIIENTVSIVICFDKP